MQPHQTSVRTSAKVVLAPSYGCGRDTRDTAPFIVIFGPFTASSLLENRAGLRKSIEALFGLLIIIIPRPSGHLQIFAEPWT